MLPAYLPVLFKNSYIYRSFTSIKYSNNVFHKTYKTHRLKSNTIFLPKENISTKLLLFRRCYYFSFCTLSKKQLLLKPPKVHLVNNRSFHPVFWFILRPLLKIIAIFTGRGFRKWWKDLPPNKKQYFLSILRKNSVRISGVISFLGLLAFMYYLSHIEEAPITNRKRFLAFNTDQFKQIGEIEFKKICMQFEHLFLPSNHPSTQRVATVVHQLLGANKDIKEIHDKSWTIAVVDDDTENAFVLPNGEIFVFGGMLKLCSNNDELGAVLAHEMSHCILAHAAENFSVSHLLDCAMIILIAGVWAIVPSDFLALFTHWLVKKIVEILFELPYNRKIEMEADEVGLKLAAKACFDIRENSAFWAKMALIQRDIKEIPDIEFLSTHPSHEKRSHHLDKLMTEALKLRSDCGCPMLKSSDPRNNVELLAKRLDEERRRYKMNQPLIIPIPK